MKEAISRKEFEAAVDLREEELRLRHLEARPMWRIVLGQFLEHRMAVAGVFVIAFFLAVALLAPVISSYNAYDPAKIDIMSWEM